MAFQPFDKSLTASMLAQYAMTPSMFDSEGVSLLGRSASSHGISMPTGVFENKDPSIGSTIEGAVSGFFDGMLAPLYESDYQPDNLIEELANSIGHLAGFAGIFPVGKLAKYLTTTTRLGSVKRVAQGAELLSKVKGFSIPMIAADAATHLLTKPTSGLIKMLGKTEADVARAAMTFLKDERHRDIIRQSFHLGVASSVSSLRHGVDAAMLNFGFGAVFGGGFGAIGNYLKIGDPMAEEFVKALAGSIFQGLPATLRGANTHEQVYEYLLGAYFGYAAKPAHIRNAHEFMAEIAKTDRVGWVMSGPVDKPGFNELSRDAQDYAKTFWRENEKAGYGLWLEMAMLKEQGYSNEQINEIFMDPMKHLEKKKSIMKEIELMIDKETKSTEELDALFERVKRGDEMSPEELARLRHQTATSGTSVGGEAPHDIRPIIEQDVGNLTDIADPNYKTKQLVIDLYNANDRIYTEQGGGDIVSGTLQYHINELFAGLKNGKEDLNTFNIRKRGQEIVKETTGYDIGLDHPYLSDLHMTMLAFRDPSSIQPLVVASKKAGGVHVDQDSKSVVPKTIIEDRLDYIFGPPENGGINASVFENFAFGSKKGNFQDIISDVEDFFKSKGNPDWKSMSKSYMQSLFGEVREWAEKNNMVYVGGRGDAVRMYYLRRDPNLPYGDPAKMRDMMKESLRVLGATKEQLELLSKDIKLYIEDYRERYGEWRGKKKITDEEIKEIYVSEFLNSISHKGILNMKQIFLEDGTIDGQELVAINGPGFVNTAIAYNKRAQIIFSRGLKPRVIDIAGHPDVEGFVDSNGDYYAMYINDMNNGRENHLADSRIEENTETTDGSQYMIGRHIAVENAAIGLNEDANAIKSFNMGFDYDRADGTELTKGMFKRSSHGMAALQEKHKIYKITRVSAGKQIGGKEVYTLRYNETTNELDIYDKNGQLVENPVLYKYNVEDMRVVQTERINDHTLADATLPKPLTFFASENDAARADFKQRSKEQVDGTEEANQIADRMIKSINAGNSVEDADLVRLLENLDNVGLGKIYAIVHGEDRRVATTLAAHIMGKSAVIEERAAREEGATEEIVNDIIAENQSKMSMMDRVIRLYGVEKPGVDHPDPLNTFIAHYFETALRNYAQNRVTRIKIRNSIYARAEGLDEWTLNQEWGKRLNDDETLFFFDDFVKHKPIRYNVGDKVYKTTLGKAWDLYSSNRVRAEEKAALEEVFEALAIRVPQSSASGAQVVKFGGFTGQEGWTVRVHPRVLRAVGGADLDGDKVFIFFGGGKHGVSKEYKDFFRSKKFENYELIEDAKDHQGDRYSISGDRMIKDPNGLYTGNIIDRKAQAAEQFAVNDPEAKAMSKDLILQYSPFQRRKMQEGASRGRGYLGSAVSSKTYMVDALRLLAQNPVTITIKNKEGDPVDYIVTARNDVESQKVFQGLSSGYIDMTADPMDFAGITEASIAKTKIMETIFDVKFASGQDVGSERIRKLVYKKLLTPFSTMNTAVYGRINDYLISPTDMIARSANTISGIDGADKTFYGTIADNIKDYHGSSSIISHHNPRSLHGVYNAFGANRKNYDDVLKVIADATEIKDGTTVYRRKTLAIEPRMFSSKEGKRKSFINLYFEHGFNDDPYIAMYNMAGDNLGAWSRILGVGSEAFPAPIEVLARKFVDETIDYVRNDFNEITAVLRMKEFLTANPDGAKYLKRAIMVSSFIKRSDFASKRAEALKRMSKIGEEDTISLSSGDGHGIKARTIEEIDEFIFNLKAKHGKVFAEALDIAMLSPFVRLERSELLERVKSKSENVRNASAYAVARTRYSTLAYRLQSIKDGEIVKFNNIYNTLFEISKAGAKRANDNFIKTFGTAESIVDVMKGEGPKSGRTEGQKMTSIMDLENELTRLKIEIDKMERQKYIVSEGAKLAPEDANPAITGHVARLKKILEQDYPGMSMYDLDLHARTLFRKDLSMLTRTEFEGFIRFLEKSKDGTFLQSLIRDFMDGAEPKGIVGRWFTWAFPDAVDRDLIRQGFLDPAISEGPYYSSLTGKLQVGPTSEPISHFGSIQFHANKYNMAMEGSSKELEGQVRNNLDFILSSDSVQGYSGKLWVGAWNMIEKVAANRLKKNRKVYAKYIEAIEGRDKAIGFDELKDMKFTAPSEKGGAIREYTGLEIMNIIRQETVKVNEILAPLLTGGIKPVTLKTDWEVIEKLTTMIEVALRTGKFDVIERIGVSNLSMINYRQVLARSHSIKDASILSDIKVLDRNPELKKLVKLAPSRVEPMETDAHIFHTLLDPVKQAEVLERRLIETLSNSKIDEKQKAVKAAETLIAIYGKVGKYPDITELIREHSKTMPEDVINRATDAHAEISYIYGFNKAKEQLAESNEEIRSNVTAKQGKERETIEQLDWDFTPDALYASINDMYSALYKAAFQAIANKKISEAKHAAEKLGFNNVKIKGMEIFFERYVSQVIGQPSIGVSLYGGDLAFLRASGYHYVADETVRNFIEGIYRKLGIRKPPEYAPNAPLFTYTELSKWGTIEAEYNLMTLLMHPKSTLANLIGGHSMTIVGTGFKNWQRSRDVEWLRKNVDSNWKSSEDITKWVIKKGLIEDFLATHYNILKSERAQWDEFMSDVLTQFGDRKILSEKDKRSITQLAETHGIRQHVMYKAAFFMRWAEVKLRRDAAVSFAIEAWESFGRALPIDHPIIINIARKGIENSQFTYSAANRPLITSTSLGKVLMRFQMYTWNSIRVRNSIIREANTFGISEHSPEFQKFKRMVIMDMFMVGLSKMFVWSIFDNAVPPHLQWASSFANFFFGDDEERKGAFYGSRLGPLQIIAPPTSRIPMFGVELLFSLYDGQLTQQAKAIGWTLLPAGRIMKSAYFTPQNPRMIAELWFGLPLASGIPKMFKESERPDSELPFR